MRKPTVSKVNPVSDSEAKQRSRNQLAESREERGKAVLRTAGGVKKWGRLFQSLLIKSNNNSNLIWPVVTRCGFSSAVDATLNACVRVPLCVFVGC